MKVLVKWIIIITLAFLASCIIGRVTFEVAEYLNPSKRYDANGKPNFVMPTVALLYGFVTSLTAFILTIIWMNKMFKNKISAK